MSEKLQAGNREFWTYLVLGVLALILLDVAVDN